MSSSRPQQPGGKKPNKAQLQQRQAAARAIAAARGRRTERVRRLRMVAIPVAVVIVVIGILVGIKLGGGPKKANSVSVAPASVVDEVTGVPASVLNKVGAVSGLAAPATGQGGALSANGLPRILYVGAEWCPICATERWPMTVALSRFGTFSGLRMTRSAANDSYPNTATLSFYGATYTSKYLVFDPREIENTNRQKLMSLDAADTKLFTQYGGSAFPYLNIAGKYQVNTAQYNPSVLAGKDQQQIADGLSDPSTDIAKGVDGSANLLSAAICATTGGRPASVCKASGVVAAAAKLPKAGA